MPSTRSQRGFGWVKIHIYCKKTFSYVAEQQLFLKKSGGNSFRYRNHNNHNSIVLFSLVDKEAETLKDLLNKIITLHMYSQL